MRKIKLMVLFLFFLLAGRACWGAEKAIPGSIGFIASPLPVGLMFSVEIPIQNDYSCVVNTGYMESTIFPGAERPYYQPFEMNFLRHYGEHKDNTGWMYNGFGLGTYQYYPNNALTVGPSKGSVFASLFLGGRYQYEWGTVFGEAYTMIGDFGIVPEFRGGARITLRSPKFEPNKDPSLWDALLYMLGSLGSTAVLAGH